MLNIVLYQPEIPQNTGNIARTCVAIGAKLWLIRPLGFRIDNHNMRRAGLDYWEHLDLEAVDSWDAFVANRKPDQFWYFTKTSNHLYSEVGFSPNDFLVFGSETNGLPPSVMQVNRDRCLGIPMSGNVRSLNLSNAVAVAAYEAVRQIGWL